MMIVSALCLSMATSCSSHSTETTSETTKKEVAIQLYSVRDLVKDGSNLDRILKDLADMGYTSVEAANYNDGKFYGKTPQEFKQMVEKNGMTVLFAHYPRVVGRGTGFGRFYGSLEMVGPVHCCP